MSSNELNCVEHCIIQQSSGINLNQPNWEEDPMLMKLKTRMIN